MCQVVTEIAKIFFEKPQIFIPLDKMKFTITAIALFVSFARALPVNPSNQRQSQQFDVASEYDAYMRLDVDGNGNIDAGELQAGIDRVGVHRQFDENGNLTPEEIARIQQEFDNMPTTQPTSRAAINQAEIDAQLAALRMWDLDGNGDEVENELMLALHALEVGELAPSSSNSAPQPTQQQAQTVQVRRIMEILRSSIVLKRKLKTCKQAVAIS